MVKTKLMSQILLERRALESDSLVDEVDMLYIKE